MNTVREAEANMQDGSAKSGGKGRTSSDESAEQR